jgi:type 1 fimbria pilin
VNAFTTPVDVLIDGTVAISSLAAGAIDTAAAVSGAHTLVLRPTGSGASAAQAIATTTGALSTIVAVRASSGGVSGVVLDDTNSVVPTGATKVRVLHLAPNAGTLQVYRTQPDFQQPVSWQFPFTYQSNPTSLSAPFYQSTVGSWEVRIWQTPADASGWATAPVKVIIPLGSGQKKTVLILDKPGGGVRVELI